MSDLQTDIEPVTSDAPPCWPPLVHRLARGERCRPGALALCGAKILGIDFTGMAVTHVCKPCEEIWLSQ